MKKKITNEQLYEEIKIANKNLQILNNNLRYFAEIITANQNAIADLISTHKNVSIKQVIKKDERNKNN